MPSSPASPLNTSSYPKFSQYLPSESVQAGKYELRFARSKQEVEAIQRLRFNVFNLEMQEGFDVSYETGKDEDAFDDVCHHLRVKALHNLMLGCCSVARLAQEPGSKMLW